MFPSNLSSKVIGVNAVRISLLISLFWYLLCLFSSPGHGSVVCNISFPPGSGIRKLAGELKAAGVIRSSWQFVLMTRLRGDAHRLKAGEYRFSDDMTPDRILDKIVSGEVDYQKFSLPEGYSVYQAAELLEQKGYFKKDVFLEKCRDTALLQRLGLKETSAEGYLYPATYNLSRGGSVEQLLEQMVGQFNKAYATIEAGVGAGRFSRHEMVTLASMIDTYLNKGLPPGPIGNPGRDAVQAAMNPAKTDYLYFVARQDGTHQFSRNLAEHNRAVVRYLK